MDTVENSKSAAADSQAEASVGHPRTSGLSSSSAARGIKSKKNTVVQSFNKLFGAQWEQWNKFLIIELHNLNISDMEIEKQLLIAIDDSEITYPTEKDSTITIKTWNTIQSEQLQNIKLLGVAPVEITPHKSLNIRKDTIMFNHINLENVSFKGAGPQIKYILESDGNL